MHVTELERDCMAPQTIRSTSFDVDDRYIVKEIVGQGAQGIICSAVDQQSQTGVAIKKVSNVFEELMTCKRLLREVRLLRLFDHDNVLHLQVCDACAHHPFDV